MVGMLDEDIILAAVAARTRASVASFALYDEISSTNAYLLSLAAPSSRQMHIALAEHQTAGRGRRERRWHSRRGADLCLSVAYAFDRLPESGAKLTLSVGIELANALQQLGAEGIRLKWPNDLMLQDGKLGGVLTESRTAANGDFVVVVGVGINVRGTDAGETAGTLDRKISYLSDAMPSCPTRNEISAALLDALHTVLSQCAAGSIADIRARWRDLDWLQGKRVSLDSDGGQLHGICRGIDDEGALILWDKDSVHHVLSGSIVDYA